MLRRNSVPYSLNVICYEDEELVPPNNANTIRRIQNTESILSGLDTGSSSYSDTNYVRGSRRRSCKKSSKNRKFKKRPPVLVVNSDRVHEGDIPEETFTYDDVPEELLFCHVCDIKFSSSQEFVAHLEDITHENLMTCLQNQFEEEAEELRRKGKAKYERDFKELGLDHVKRKSYCIMCNADIPESLSKHRRTELHMTLRKYLHPECDLCVKNFKTRIEWTRHLLMPTHLMKAAASNIHMDTLQNFEYTAGASNVHMDTLQNFEYTAVASNVHMDTLQNFEYTADEVDHFENIDSDLVKKEKEEEEEEEEQTEQHNADSRDQINFCIKEEPEAEIGNIHNTGSAEGEYSRVCSDINEYYNEGDSQVSDHSVRAKMETTIVKREEGHQDSDLTTEYFIDEEGFRVPVYKEGRVWGKSLLKEVTGHVCRGCKRFFDCDDLVNAHCQSRAHFDMFISLMKRKILHETSSVSKTSGDAEKISQKRMLSPGEKGAKQKFLKRI